MLNPWRNILLFGRNRTPSEAECLKHMHHDRRPAVSRPPSTLQVPEASHRNHYRKGDLYDSKCKQSYVLGRLGKDADTKFTLSGVAVTKFCVATSVCRDTPTPFDRAEVRFRRRAFISGGNFS
jgi:hypothetical protein